MARRQASVGVAAAWRLNGRVEDIPVGLVAVLQERLPRKATVRVPRQGGSEAAWLVAGLDNRMYRNWAAV
jgi:hypothetical protein